MKSLGVKIGVFILLFVSVAYVTFAMDKGRPYYEKKGHVLWDIKTEEKVIALTFDDGPHSIYTPEILELLAEYDAKATFFVIGERAEKFPDLIRQMDKEGHEVANHTYTHPHSITPEKLAKELKMTNEVIHDIIGN